MSQQAVWTWNNDEPFGDSVPNQNPSGAGQFTFNQRFPGQYADSETGLNQNYYREYDPATERYPQSDPIGLGGGINTYAYVKGNPIELNDPIGLLSQAVSDCVCKYMKANSYSAWQSWNAVLTERKRNHQWNDPVLRPCENYLYAFAAMVDYGDSPQKTRAGVLFHDLQKYVAPGTSPPSQEAKDAGYEGVDDAIDKRDWKQTCEKCKKGGA
jgi:RHS repeat-associated protein